MNNNDMVPIKNNNIHSFYQQNLYGPALLNMCAEPQRDIRDKNSKKNTRTANHAQHQKGAD